MAKIERATKTENNSDNSSNVSSSDCELFNPDESIVPPGKIQQENRHYYRQ